MMICQSPVTVSMDWIVEKTRLSWCGWRWSSFLLFWECIRWMFGIWAPRGVSDDWSMLPYRARGVSDDWSMPDLPSRHEKRSLSSWSTRLMRSVSTRILSGVFGVNLFRSRITRRSTSASTRVFPDPIVISTSHTFSEGRYESGSPRKFCIWDTRSETSSPTAWEESVWAYLMISRRRISLPSFWYGRRGDVDADESKNGVWGSRC